MSPMTPLVDTFPNTSPVRPLRVALVTEAFPPQINGVTDSVCRVLEHLAAEGHQALPAAPRGPRT